MLFSKQLRFEPVEQDDDELIQAIENDVDRQDDLWRLKTGTEEPINPRLWEEALREQDQEESAD